MIFFKKFKDFIIVRTIHRAQFAAHNLPRTIHHVQFTAHNSLQHNSPRFIHHEKIKNPLDEFLILIDHV
jgi:hypothetical protein